MICYIFKFLGEYSCLSVDLVFKRQFSYYLITIYVPGCMLVVVSWVSFWLDPHAVPARVALGVTTLLTMSTQTASINNSLPPVAYTKAIDVWQGVCVTFVFSALLEYALVNYALRGDRSYILRRAMARRRRRAGGYSGDDDDYDHGGDDMDYGMDYGDSDEDSDLFLNQPDNETQNSSDIFQSHTSSNNISYDNGKRNKGVLFSQDENESIPNLRRRSGALSFLPSFRSIKRKSLRRNNNQQVKNNILMNPPIVGIQPHLDNSTKSALLLNTLGNHAAVTTTSQFGTLGSGSNLTEVDEPKVQVINGGFVSDSGSHLDTNKMNAPSNQDAGALSAIPPEQSVKFKNGLGHLGCQQGPSVPMEKAKRIDVTARILFPLIFATFNLAYWLNYLLQARSEFQALLLKNDSHINPNKS